MFILTNSSVTLCLFKTLLRLKTYSIQLLIAEKSQNCFSACESLCTNLSLWLKVHISQNFFLQILSGAQNAKTWKQNIFSQITVNCSLIYCIRYWVLASGFNTFTLFDQLLFQVWEDFVSNTIYPSIYAPSEKCHWMTSHLFWKFWVHPKESRFHFRDKEILHLLSWVYIIFWVLEMDLILV